MSDSHRNLNHMLYAVRQAEPDVIIHLGDHIADARELKRRLPEPTYHLVKGNCDVHAFGDAESLVTLDGLKILITHGHKYGVKNGLAALIEGAQLKGAGLVLFGHTHQPTIKELQGLWLMNPGQMGRHDSGAPASYGIVTITSGVPNCEIARLPLQK